MHKSQIISSDQLDFIQQRLLELKHKFDINQSSPDYFELRSEGASIGIKKTKELKRWAVLKPYDSVSKLAVIYDSELLTPEAQNSLLKILEEPNAYTSLILVTQNYRRLLPTIISRCEVVEQYDHVQTDPLEADAEMSLVDNLAKVNKVLSIKDSTKQKNEINDLLVSLLNYNRGMMFHDPKAYSNVKLINDSIFRISKNVSKRLALENLFINLTQT